MQTNNENYISKIINKDLEYEIIDENARLAISQLESNKADKKTLDEIIEHIKMTDEVVSDSLSSIYKDLGDNSEIISTSLNEINIRINKLDKYIKNHSFSDVNSSTIIKKLPTKDLLYYLTTNDNSANISTNINKYNFISNEYNSQINNIEFNTKYLYIAIDDNYKFEIKSGNNEDLTNDFTYVSKISYNSKQYKLYQLYQEIELNVKVNINISKI